MTAVAVTPSAESPLLIDRYAIYDAIAAGGMATVHLGRLVGPAGFLRTVAVKRLHAHYAGDAEFTTMLLDEARVAARIAHPNVVSTLDVVVSGAEILLVMDYVRGESLARLLRRAREREERPSTRIVVAIIGGALEGLHSAHEAVNERGQPLGLIHRDVSPQNILVGEDGIARVLDFGIAKAEGRVSSTQDGKIKGKILYMPPEQLAAEAVTRTADIYAVGVLLFEALTNVRMFAGDNERAALSKIISGQIRVPSEIEPSLAPFDEVVRRATALDPGARYQTAAEMAEALQECDSPATSSHVAAWVQDLVGDVLEERARVVAEIERSSTRSRPPLAANTPAASTRANPLHLDTMPVPARVAESIPVPVHEEAELLGGRGLKLVPKRSRAMGGAAAALAVLFVAALGVIAFLVTRRPKDTDARAAVPEQVGVPAFHVGAKMVSPSVDPSAPSASAVAVNGTTPVATSSVVAPGNSSSTGVTGSSSTPSVPSAAPHAVVARPTVNCDPPYTIDKSGRKHFIPECLR